MKWGLLLIMDEKPFCSKLKTSLYFKIFFSVICETLSYKEHIENTLPYGITHKTPIPRTLPGIFR